MKFWSRFIAWLKGVFGGGSSSPEGMRRKVYREIERRESKIGEYKDALAGLVTRQQKLIVQVRGWSEEMEKLEDLKHAAAVSTRVLVEALKAEGQDAEAALGSLRTYNQPYQSTTQEAGVIAERSAS